MGKDQEIVAIARSWIGTPFEDRACIKGERGGVDCLQLIRGIYREYYGVDIKDIPVYQATQYDLSNVEVYFNGLSKYLTYIGDSWSMIKPGRVVMFRFRPELAMKHAGVITEGYDMVHAMSRINRKVIEESMNNRVWRNKLAAVFEFPSKKEVLG